MQSGVQRIPMERNMDCVERTEKGGRKVNRKKAGEVHSAGKTKGSKSYEIDMCNGPLLGKIIFFAVPLMLSGILQLLFNAADIVVVGQFVGSQALAAVGSTGSLINLLINVFIGLSIGTNVLVAQYYGAKREKDVSETIHTAILISLICGVALIVIGISLSRQMLIWMGTPEDVLDQATLYMQIYFMGMPVMMLYNFGSAILRAVGDTRRPLYFLFLAGIVNVILNLFFVIVLNMGVAGVATATVISQVISSLLVLRCLVKSEGCLHVHLKQLRIHKDKLLRMIRIGVPAGMQGAIFSISNVLIQSSVNSFGSLTMAGNTAASNIEGFVYNAMNAFHQTALSFTSQNLGGGKPERIKKVALMCQLLVMIVGIVMGYGAYFLGTQLLHIYSSDPQVVSFGLQRMQIICTTYFFCGMMDTMVGVLRGLGYSIMPMMVSLIGSCLLRIVWIFTIFAWDSTLFVLYLSYPVSWVLTWAVHVICYFAVKKKWDRKPASA